MNAQHQSASPAEAAADLQHQRVGSRAAEYPDEKIGVAKIEVKQTRMRLTAILGGFVEVDRLLMAWGSKTNDLIACDFEVTFLDGYKLGGVYEYCCKTSKRLSLSNFIRACLSKSQRDNAVSRKQKIKRIVDIAGDIVNESILDRYEIERTG
jgi:hypothetical protein